MSLKDYSKHLREKSRQLAHWEQTVKEEEAALEEVLLEVQDTQKALEIAQLVAQQTQQQAHDKIAHVVSRCLEAVFETPYQFKIRFERKRGKTEAQLLFEREGNELDPISAAGIGVIDVAAFALRLAALLLSRPAVRKFIIFDEPFRHLKPYQDYHPKVEQLLTTLSEEMQVQFVIIPQNDDYAIGKVVPI